FFPQRQGSHPTSLEKRLNEGKMGQNGGKMGTFTVSAGGNREPTGPEMRGDAEEVERFGRGDFAKVLFKTEDATHNRFDSTLLHWRYLTPKCQEGRIPSPRSHPDRRRSCRVPSHGAADDGSHPYLVRRRAGRPLYRRATLAAGL